jgi:hypothetical protein
MNTTQKRLRILGDDEITVLYQRPNFTHEERLEYFTLSQSEKDLLHQFRSIRSKIYFILQLGYFKAQHLFFTFHRNEVEADIQYILGQYFPHVKMDDLSAIDHRTGLRQRRLILKLYNYRNCDAEARRQLETKARQAAMVCSKPIYVFREIIHYLQTERIVAPGYSFLQDTVGKALHFEQKRLKAIVRHHLTPSDIEALKALLSDLQGLYEITLLKREPKDFSIKAIDREISRGRQIHHLYCLAKRLLPDLLISNESIKYYASLVNYYSVFRLHQLDEFLVYVYLLCFVYHRYQKLHDNLILSLIYDVRQYADEAKAAAKERVYQYRIEANQDLQKAGQVLKLFTNDNIAEQTPFHHVKAKAFSILQRDKLDFIADHIAKNVRFDETAFQWEHIDKLANQFKRHLRPILLAVDFAASQAYNPLIEAVAFLKEAFGKGRSLGQYSPQRFPRQFIPSNTKRYLYRQETPRQKHFLKDRYEFLVYRLLRNGLEAGDIFCRDSVRFRSFEDDLVNDEQWQQKEQLIADTGLAALKQPIKEHLAALEQRLEERITCVNQRIISGENEHFQIKKRGKQSRWTLQYPRASEQVNHPFFDTLTQVDISDVLHFVNHQCQFIEVFEHVLGRYAKQERDDCVLIAGLVAWATNTGLSRMGELSD